jgi:DnaJ family protein C protein 9
MAHDDSSDFDWPEFYSSQFKDVITTDAIEEFSKAYKGSDEEKDDVLKYYQVGKGDWDSIYENVMVSNPLNDEDRFREYINKAIEEGDVKGYKAYLQESEEKKQRRYNGYEKEASEAIEYAKKLNIHDKLFGPGDKPVAKDGLAALIQKKQADRGMAFLDDLEAKYKDIEQRGKKKGKKGKRVQADEDEDMGMPDEAAFQAAAARLNKPKETVDPGEGSGRKAKRAKRS